MVAPEQWVEVLVPQHLVPDVYGLIAERMAKGSTSGPVAVSEELFSRMFLESPPAMRKLLVLLADDAGRNFPTAEICGALDLTPAQLAGVLGAFGRRVKNRYKGAKKPFQARWDPDPAQHTWLYRMDAEVAEVIKRTARDVEE
ncbi:MAG: hypothetical protein AB1551_09205 [Actinomycetota bacterium]